MTYECRCCHKMLPYEDFYLTTWGGYEDFHKSKPIQCKECHKFERTKGDLRGMLTKICNKYNVPIPDVNEEIDSLLTDEIINLKLIINKLYANLPRYDTSKH